MAEKSFHGVRRSQIPWYPIIDYEKCISCGKCVDFCHMKTFGTEEKDGKKKTFVKKLNSCIVLCRGCEDICPAGAISHPSDEETKKLIERLQKAKA